MPDVGQVAREDPKALKDIAEATHHHQRQARDQEEETRGGTGQAVRPKGKHDVIVVEPTTMRIGGLPRPNPQTTRNPTQSLDPHHPLLVKRKGGAGVGVPALTIFYSAGDLRHRRTAVNAAMGVYGRLGREFLRDQPKLW